MDIRTYWILGSLILAFGIYVSLIVSVPWGSIVITGAFALFGIAVSKTSERLPPYLSIQLAIDALEDRRLILREKLIKINHKLRYYRTSYTQSADWKNDKVDYKIYFSFSIWKCKEYLDRIEEMEKYLREKNKKKLLHLINCLFLELAEGKLRINIRLSKEYIGHLEQMVAYISTFKKFTEDTNKAKDIRRMVLGNLKVLKGLSKSIQKFK